MRLICSDSAETRGLASESEIDATTEGHSPRKRARISMNLNFKGSEL